MTLKKTIRASITQQRKALSDQDIAKRADLALTQFIPLFEQYRPETIAAYHPIENEFDISKITNHCKNSGIKILYPRIKAKNTALTFHHANEFILNKYNILEPAETAPQYQPDMIICPFIGVDKNNKRLGFGGGFYDRTLAELPNTITIAIGYDFQYITDFGAESHDMVFDHIILI